MKKNEGIRKKKLLLKENTNQARQLGINWNTYVQKKTNEEEPK